MHAPRAAKPEFNAFGGDIPTTPMWRARNVHRIASGEYFRRIKVETLDGLPDFVDQGLSPCDGLGLIAGPGAEAAFPRTCGEVRIALLFAGTSGDPLDANLTIECVPMELQ